MTENKIHEIEKKIAKEVDKHRDLRVLTEAGVDRKKMLRFLAVVVDEDGDKNWPNLMRERQQKLKSIAGRMETLARDAEGRASDPLSRVQAWAFLAAHGSVLGMEWPKAWKDDAGVPFIIAGMRALANIWRAEAIKFGRFLDFYGDSRTNLALPILLCRVCLCIQKPNPDHWNELANLLTDAFEVVGKRKRFSADSLRKVWKRRGKRLLMLLLKLNAQPAPENPTPAPAVSRLVSNI